MDTSEIEQGVVSSAGYPAVVTSGDKIYQGINFSSLKRELSIQKLWQERTWKEILRHFFVALIIGALGSFVDIGTDGLTAKSFIQGANYTKWVKNLSDPANHNDCVHTGRFTSFNPAPEIEYEEIVCFEQDPKWGIATIVFILFPGIAFAGEVSQIIQDVRGKRSDEFYYLRFVCLAVPCLIIFPFVLISVKVVCLINPGPEWKRANARITGMEASCESAFQTVLTLFIIFTRADRQPSRVQIASLVASFVMITKASIAEHLSPKQPMELKEELKATATLLPLFLSSATFKLLSFAIIFTCLRDCWILEVLGPWTLFAAGSTLRLEATKRENMESCVFIEIIMEISHLIVLTSLVGAANINSDSLNYTARNIVYNGPSSDISKRPSLVDNLPLLNGLYVGILAAMAINTVLFYFQMWKPMVEEEEAEQRRSKETESPRNVQTGSEEGKYCEEGKPHQEGNPDQPGASAVYIPVQLL